jgi:hypothetical protein
MTHPKLLNGLNYESKGENNVGTPEILKIRTLATLDAHNFLCRPPIEVRSKEKL